MKKILNQSIDILNLSTRARNAVSYTLYRTPENKKYFTIKELLSLTVNDFKRTINVGEVTVKEIRTSLRNINLFLKGDSPSVFSEKAYKHLSDTHKSILWTINDLGNDYPKEVIELKKILKRICVLQNK